MTQEEFRYLLRKYKAGTATPAERELIEQWYDTIGRGEHTHMSPDQEQTLEKQFRAHVDHYITTAGQPGRQRFLQFWPAAGIAASFLLVCLFLFYFYYPTSTDATGQLTSIPVLTADDAE